MRRRVPVPGLSRVVRPVPRPAGKQVPQLEARLEERRGQQAPLQAPRAVLRALLRGLLVRVPRPAVRLVPLPEALRSDHKMFAYWPEIPLY